MAALYQQKCVPCEGGVDPMNSNEIDKYLQLVNDWTVQDQKQLSKKFTFKDFDQAMKFVNKVADIAESEGHHPDISIHDWNKVDITLSTHAIKGLSVNDFVLASKIDHI